MKDGKSNALFTFSGNKSLIIARLEKLLPDSILCTIAFFEDFSKFYACRILGILSTVVDMKMKRVPLNVYIEIDKIAPMTIDAFEKKSTTMGIRSQYWLAWMNLNCPMKIPTLQYSCC